MRMAFAAVGVAAALAVISACGGSSSGASGQSGRGAEPTPIHRTQSGGAGTTIAACSAVAQADA
ncbi:MAG: hypothetical protein ABR498_01010, partial [Candidatus Dormibacteria bacterium]